MDLPVSRIHQQTLKNTCLSHTQPYSAILVTRWRLHELRWNRILWNTPLRSGYCEIHPLRQVITFVISQYRKPKLRWVIVEAAERSVSVTTVDLSVSTVSIYVNFIVSTHWPLQSQHIGLSSLYTLDATDSTHLDLTASTPWTSQSLHIGLLSLYTFGLSSLYSMIRFIRRQNTQTLNGGVWLLKLWTFGLCNKHI